MIAKVEDGKVISVGGDEEQPFTNGFLCTKTNHYLERLYSPERILHPLRRVGAKGSGEFEQISFDEAIETIAARFKNIVQEFGAEAILPFSYGGNMGKLAFASMDRRFFHYLGASLLDRTICATAATEGYLYTMGAKMGTDPEGLPHSRLIVAWGANLVSSNTHIMPFVNQARKNGARLVVIDPHKNKTAEQADIFLQPLPGTDGALALAVMHVLIKENLYDSDFVEKNTVGFAQLKEHVESFTPEWAAAQTGLTVDEIVDFARLYGTLKPSCIRLNYGLSRHTNGGMMVRAVSCLPALVGTWGKVGGGAMLSVSGTFPLNQGALERSDLLKRHPKVPRTINMIKLGEALDDKENPVKALFVYNSNPAAVVPDQKRVIEGLKRDDLFTVVHEQVMTDTALYADIVLPAPTVFEDFDLYGSYGHLYLQLNQPAVPPLGEATANVEVFRALAKAMGYTDPCFDDSAEDMVRQALQPTGPLAEHLEGISYERLKEEGFVRLNVPYPYVPFADSHYPTPSGKIELYSETLLRAGLPPLPVHSPSLESPEAAPALAARYPLRFVSPAAHHFLNSSFADMPTMRRREKYPILEMNSFDAACRGLQDGVWVRAFNDRGETFFKLKITDAVKPGVTCHVSLWWRKYSPGGNNCNVLTSAEAADMGGGATFHSCLIEVQASHENFD